MKFRSLALILLSISISSLLFATPVSQNGALQSKNGKIVSSKTGNPIQVAGPSLYWAEWGGEKFYNAGVVTKVATSWNATVIRAAISVNPEDGKIGYIKNPQKQLGYAKAVVDAAIDNGIYVIVDWHDHHADQNFNAAKEFFTEMAKTYKNVPNVIWEIWNEPMDVSWASVKGYADKIVPVIREHSSNLIVAGTPLWCQKPNDALADPIKDDNVAYALHFYSGSHDEWQRSNAEKAMAGGLAIFITEFGLSEYTGGKIDRTVYKDKAKVWLDWADKKQISWANWSLADIDEACSIIKPGKSTSGNWSESDLTESGTWVVQRLKDRPKMVDDGFVSIIGSPNVKEGGSVTATPNDKRVKKGTKVTLKATPASGWEFVSWGNGSKDAEITITAEANIVLEATFSPGSGTNMLKNGDFTTSADWVSYVHKVEGNDATITFSSGQANIRINAISGIEGNEWGVQISQGGLQLDKGTTYTISLDAWSTGEREIQVQLSSDITYSWLGGENISLNNNKQPFIINITPDSTTSVGKIQVNAGYSTLPVFIDNIKMFKALKTGNLNTKAIKISQSFATFNKIGNNIYWTSTSPKTKVALTDMSGRIFQSVTGSKPIHLTNMSTGLFFLVATDGINRQIFQFVK